MQPAAQAGADGAGEERGEDYHTMRSRRERAEAMMAEIDLAKASGKVLDREPALRAIFTKYRELRDTALVLGRRLAPVVAPMTDEREIRITIDRAMAEVFERFVQRSLQPLVDGVTGSPVSVPPEVSAAPEPADQWMPEPGGAGSVAPGPTP
jgi:CBS domain-containing protein